MGYLQHHQFAVQDIFQIEFYQSFKKYLEGDPSLQRRYATS
jgi:hypothetical protein